MGSHVGYLQKALQWYSKCLKVRPFTTQISSSAVLWYVIYQILSHKSCAYHCREVEFRDHLICRAMGDALAQKIEKRADFDPKRFLMTSSYGGLFNGTIGHVWYLQLDKYAHRWFTQGTRSFVAAKVAADSILFGPIHICAFFTLLTLAENGTFKDVEKKIKTDALPTFIAELSVWPIVQAVNFTKVPVQYQLLVVNAFTIADATFMSFIQHNNAWFDKVLARLKENSQ